MTHRRLAWLFALSLSPLAWGHHVWPEIIPVAIEKAYIPVGFDDNDLTQIVVTGTLINSCHWENSTEVKVDTVEKKIRIKQLAHGYPGRCVPARIPYTKTVDLGILPPATYTLLDVVGGGVLGTVLVTKAAPISSPGPFIDDNPYALVLDAFILSKHEAAEPTLALDIKVPNSCFRFKEAAIGYHDRAIVVRPLTERIATTGCSDDTRSFRVKIPLKRGVEGKQLLHVRSLLGRSFNKIVETSELVPLP